MVHAFGDSFTNKDCKRGQETHLDLGYFDYIAKELNTGVSSAAFPGCSCYNVLNLLTSRLYKIESGDVVIVLLPPFDRKDYPSSQNVIYQRLMGDQTKQFEEREPMQTLQGFPMWSAVYQYLDNRRDMKFVNDRFSQIDYIRDSSNEDLNYNLDILFKFLILSNSQNHIHEENYFLTWFSNLGLFFSKNKIIFKVYTFEWWDSIRFITNTAKDQDTGALCECGHWNEFEHILFSKQVLKDIETVPNQIIHRP